MDMESPSTSHRITVYRRRQRRDRFVRSLRSAGWPTAFAGLLLLMLGGLFGLLH
jgi:hypothetical protein